ncbi:conserved repeat domain-containing protein/gliding motility-associated C-terminal domain-containing protein [Chitinophaga sp. YR627]|uniref:T9SS type B sorting domain-containing protein n=1 Tax=Chitinophaga sp. YR627 TaxID=1881041 RepID=UPI0008F3225C|nr:gliding motility-associated C-terminal domain-containing protein [Chitinophaga sp. YR627]SFO47618.1 conserved repeat domain-containing protein/gliding motility-associated C-terminal domain-containing protein [Chitinophaga sp. YR627]
MGILFPGQRQLDGGFITYSIQMDKFYKAKFALLFLFAGLFATHDSRAEGSKDLYPNGAGGGRACLVSTNATKAGWSLTNTGVHYAYVNAGETIGAASSAQGIGSGQLVLTAPDGTVYSSTIGSTTVGQIANRTAEKAGPWSGYTPFTRVAGAGQTGLWKVEFLSTLPSNQITEGAGANWTADEAWTQNASSSAICAWDVSVRTAGGVMQSGRVYTNVLNMYVQHNDYQAKLYVLTNDGYLFKVNNNGLDGLGFVAFVNNKGLTDKGKDTDPPLYKSVAGTAYNNEIYTWDPRKDDGVYSVTHKMFYQVPDATLPASAPQPGGKTTWLNVPKVIPTISNISVDGVEGTSGQVSSKGAYIKFDANTIGTYRISLEGTGSFVTRKITGTAAKGTNSIFWDGKDGAGVAPALGVANVVAKVQLQGSEIHFPFIDVETNSKGLIIEQLKDDHVTVENDIVYWADSTFSGGAGIASNPLINGNEGSGISSNSNGHKWGLDFGNNRTMDTWTYILGDVATKNTSLNIVRADLAIQSVGPSVGGTTQVYQGQSIDYRVVVVNNGPSDVTGAPFAIKVPAGFTIASVSDVTYTTSCGTVNSASLTGGNYSALLDLPNGCNIIFTFKGTPSTTGAINIETSIMRPKDVTDPDATNPDATVPPTDPHLECKNGTATENCNNIKYSSTVTAIPNVNIVVNKTTAATSYVPGGTVVYTFTVTNTSSANAASNVHVTDNAPGVTTIGSWTAAFTTGTGTLPATSGTGNINQTITTLPAGAVVTYTVTVNVPGGFTGTLQNTASASSPDDAVTTDNTSTTTPIPVVPRANLVVSKSTGATQFVPGGTAIVYTIGVTNDGPDDAVNVNVTDNLPTGAASMSWTATATAGVTLPAASGTGSINEIIASLPNGSTVTYTVTVTTSAAFNSPLVNSASATSDLLDPVTGDNISTVILPPNRQSDIGVVKSTTATTFAPGEDVTYTFTVTNNGPSDGSNVSVTDNAPAGTTIKSWTAVTTTGTATVPVTSGAGNINETITELPNGAVVTYTVVVTTTSNFTGNLSNTATATNATDIVGTNNSSTTTPITPSPKADIVVVKSTAATTFAPGEDVTYTITVTNNGPSDATNVTVTDNAPTGTTIKAWTAVATTGIVNLTNVTGSGNINESIALLPNGAVVTYTVVVATPSNFSTNLINTAGANSSVADPVATNNNSTTTGITPAPKADIAVVKSTTATTFAPGEDVTYTITVTNNGPSDAANVVVTDNAPTGTTIKSWTAAVTTGTVTLPAASGTGNINESIANVPNGAVVTYTVVVSTPASFTANLSNTAAGSSDATDPVPANNNSTTTGIVPAPKADIAVVKSTTATSFAPGEDVTYTITVTNNGPSDAANVVVTDNAPTGTTIRSWTAAVTTGTVTLPATSGSGNINESITNVPNGAVVTYTVIVSTPANFTANLSNTAAGSSDATDPVPANNNSTTTGIAPTPKADIAVVKSTTATTFAPGEEVTYTITVTNNGPSDAANVVVTDNAPAGTTIKSWSAVVTTGTVTLPAASGTGNISQTIANVPNGAVVTYTVVVSTPASFTANLSNTASGSSDATDLVPANNNSTTTSITPSPKADIAVVKSTTATSFAPGEDVTYTITVTNNGPSDAANVVVTDNAPIGTTIKSWSAVVTTGTVTLPAASGTGNISQTIANVPNGAVVTYTVVVSTPASFTANLSNTASGSSDATDPVPANNNSTTTGIAPAPKADIVVVKSTTATSFAPGEDVTYTITVSNNGPSDAANVVVTDNAPTGTTIKSWSAAVTTGTVTLPAASGTGNINQTITKVPNGAVVTYTVVVATPASFTANLSNTAAGSSDATDPVPANNNSTTTGIAPTPKADIAVVKSTTATTFAPGEDVTYTITVTNNGPSDAANVVVTDNAPVGTTIRSWTAAVTTGTVTLPATSGSGNINESITKVPNGAVVTYNVVVSTPANFTANLSNTASGSSDATDPTPANNSSTTTGITPAPKADMAVVKTTAATTFAPGEDVTYTITVTNNGPSDAANVKVIDNAPTGTTIKSWTAAVTTGTVTLPAASGSGNISQTIAKVPPAAVVTYTVVVSTTSGFTGNLSNTATVSSDVTDNTPANNISTTPGITPAPKADIAVVKATTATTFAPGEDVTYTITVTNNGPSDAANVKVIDNAPTGTTIKSWTAAVKTGTVTLPAASGTGNINQTIANVPNGAAVSYTVIVSTPASFTGNLSNTASGSSDATDPTPANNSSTTTGIAPTPKADIAVVKTTTATTFAPGEDVTYTITVTNNGPSDAANVKVIDNAPTGTTIKSWTAAVKTGTVTLPAASGTGNISQTIANVPNGAAVTYTVVVSTPASFTGNLSNTASGSSDATDPTPGNNTSTTPGITPSPKADIAVVKTTAATAFAPGEDVTYTITVTNNGPGDAANVKVIDNAPTGTTIKSWTAAVKTGTVTLPAASGTGNISQTIAKVPNGAAVTYTVIVSTPASFTGNLSNTASGSSDATDPTPGNNTSTTPGITPSPKADIAVAKTTTATTFAPGEDVTYTITVTNNGPSDAANVKVIDNAPTGTTIKSWTAVVKTGTVTLPAASGTGNINQTIAKVPNGAAVTYTVIVSTPASFTGNLSNTASGSSDATDPTPGNNTSTTPGITPSPKADIAVVKTTAATSFAPGEDVTYTITVSNNGPGDAANVKVIDNAPTGTTIKSWTVAVKTGTVTLPAASGTGNISQTIAKVPNGAAVTYTVVVSTPANFTASLSNTASATSDATDNTPGNNTSTTTGLTPTAKADVEVVKTLKNTTQTTFKPGEDVFYYITIKNNGPSDAKNVNVKDVAPAGTTIFYWGVNILNGTVSLPNRNGNTDINETVALLPAGAVIRYEVGVRVHADHTGNLTNTATISSTTTDAVPGNNTSTSPALTDDAKADVVVTKKLKNAAQTSAVAGVPLEYVITVTNNGPDAAALVKVKDVAPAGTMISTWEAAILSGTPDITEIGGAGNIDAVINSLPSGAVVAYNVTVVIPGDYSAATISNTAVANSQTADPVTTNNSATTPALPVVGEADLEISKTTSAQDYVPGRTLEYTIDVTNVGPSVAKSVNVKDIAPAGTTISAWTATVTNGTVTLPANNGTGDLDQTIAVMAVNAVVRYSVMVAVPVDFRGDITNTATVVTTTTDKNQTNNSSTTAVLKPVQSADLEVTKQLKDPAQKNFVAGKDVVYLITVKNNGPAPATKVNIKDLAPAGTTIGSWTATVTSGTVTLPNASGTGDLNETIAMMPDQSVVTYEVVVKTPDTYQGALVNTVDVSSETSDPAPTCAACTAPAVAADPLPEADTDDYGNVRADNPVTIPVLKNDKPGDNNTPLDPKSVEIVTQPAHGTVVVNEDGTIVYTPTPGYNGPDSFTYRVQDQNGSWSNVATVNMNIVPDEITVPNVITPNGDGANDKLEIKGLNKFVQNEIIIYNRWNNVLYKKQNYQGEWDGQGLNAGTYYYTLKGLDANGQWHTYNGYIMLLR